MIKPALLIAILTLAVTTMADNRMSMGAGPQFRRAPAIFHKSDSEAQRRRINGSLQSNVPADTRRVASAFQILTATFTSASGTVTK
jgi:hypothetical protein